MKINVNLDKEYIFMKDVKERLERSIETDKKTIQRFPSFAQKDLHNTFIKEMQEDEVELEKINRAIVCNHDFEPMSSFLENGIETQMCVNCGIILQVKATLGWFQKEKGDKI